MTTVAHARTDSRTMLCRQLVHLRRYPSLTGLLIGMPVIFLLLFAYVFGGTLGVGIGGDRAAYINYLTPGILLFTVAGAAAGPAISVATDMTGGIVDRFRSMAIARGALLTGHVLGSMIQTLISTALVIAVALLLGFRPTAGALDWLAVLGLLALLAFALTWLAVLIGLVSKTPSRRATRRC